MKRFLLMAIVISLLVNVQTVEPLENDKQSGFSVFTEEEKERFEALGYDMQKIESSIKTGEYTKEEVLQSADWKENELSMEAERQASQDAKNIEQERGAGALPSSCICAKPTLMLPPKGEGKASMGLIHHCKCGKLDCVRHRSGSKNSAFNLFCEEVGHFSKENTQPCVCSISKRRDKGSH